MLACADRRKSSELCQHQLRLTLPPNYDYLCVDALIIDSGCAMVESLQGSISHGAMYSSREGSFVFQRRANAHPFDKLSALESRAAEKKTGKKRCG
jgi:hypothetical protein